MKIAINACFGGFSLSYAGVMKYGELKGIKIYAYTYGRGPGGKIDFDNPNVPYNPESGVEDPTMIHYYLAPKLEGGDFPQDSYFSDRDIERNDPILIRVIEELGPKADGMCAGLEVIEIPDDIDWEIEEYGGNEHVAEKHRTWG